jgi:polyhydroxyalkanoate synthesis regulator phasin
MSDQSELNELVNFLVRSTRLTRPEAARVVQEVLAFLDETPDSFIRRRHLALQAEGCSNNEIFSRLTAELQSLRFRAADLTERQIRRIIYG